MDMAGKYVKVGAKITFLNGDVSTSRAELFVYSEIAKYGEKRFLVWSPMSHNPLSFCKNDTICVFNVGREGEIAEIRTTYLTDEGFRHTIILGIVRNYEARMYTVENVCKVLLVNIVPLIHFDEKAFITENKLAERIEKMLKKVKENER